MNKTIWRVLWNLAGTKGPQQSVEFSTEEKAIDWADGLLRGGANGVTAVELAVGRSIHFPVSATFISFMSIEEAKTRFPRTPIPPKEGY